MQQISMAPIVYAACVASLEVEACYRAAFDAIAPWQQRHVDRYHSPVQKRLTLAAALLLRHGLRRVGREAVLDAGITRNAHGKPYLNAHDVWFNTSQSGAWAICAVTGCEVGCDVERLAPVDIAASQLFFCTQEYAHLAAQSDLAAQQELFFRYWTLKESFLKATGMGMALPPSTCHIVLGESIRVVQSADARQFSFCEFGDIPGYKCALCVAGSCEHASMEIVDVRELV